MKMRDRQLLLDMLESSRLAVSYLEGTSIDEFLEDMRLQDAVIRRIGIIGEAARQISDLTRQSHADIPWHEINGMRNRIIHEYANIDLVVIWDTVHNSLPDLISVLEKTGEIDEIG